MTMLPVLALVGRPNVGKSTLFNRLTRTRDAIVANVPRLTRDRQYGTGKLGEVPFIVIDTGGITSEQANAGNNANPDDESPIDTAVAAQSLQAMEEATVCLLLVDAQVGLQPDDSRILDHLRKTARPFLLVVNKVDDMDPDQACAEFYRSGVERLFPLTATRGWGVGALLQACLTGCSEDTGVAVAPEHCGIRIAVSGRPNVGKSTLVNRILGEPRVLVHDQSGTTRDSVYIAFERHGQPYTLIDTAGIRRRGKTMDTVEKFSVVKSLQAIKQAHVVLLLIDARTGIVEQDLHLLGFVIESGRALVIAINKWDGMEQSEKLRIRSEINRRLGFVDFASIHFISALHGTGVGDLYQSIDQAHESAGKQLGTSVLTDILQQAVLHHQPPRVNGRRIKLRYAHAGGKHPPTIVVHGKQTDKLPAHYRRYLEKTFRTALQLQGTPISIELKSDDNPFVRRQQRRAPQQLARKRRIAKHRSASRSGRL